MNDRMVTVVVPPQGRTALRGLPYEGRRGSGYARVEAAIGATRKGQVEYARGAFTVARTHTVQLVDALRHQFWVRVVKYAGTVTCVSACWDASPDTWLTCDCSCAGSNHGTNRPLEEIVIADGRCGEVAVTRGGPRDVILPRYR